MVWRTSPPPPKPTTVSSKLVPLIILLLLCVLLAVICYSLYLCARQISSAAAAKLESKHLSLSKGGLRVGIKDLETESYVDKTRGVLVNAWYLSTWPAYKSRLWNKLPPGAAGGTGPDGARERKPHTKVSPPIPAK